MLALSAVVVGIGALVFAYWVPIHQRLRARSSLDRLDVEHVYDALIRRVDSNARAIARRVQHGDLRRYLWMVIAAAAGFVVWGMLAARAVPRLPDGLGELRVGPLEKGARIKLSDNPLARDLKAVTDQEKDFEYAEYVAHSYYVECHELYDYSASHFEFVSSAMPLFGLIGTVVGLMAMFDSLGADVSVESLSPQLALALKTTLYGAVLSSVYRIIGTRFEQRMKALDYDFETFCRALQVLVENRVKIEVQR
jgi:biopolymer transport protein ExbB/TolQ